MSLYQGPSEQTRCLYCVHKHLTCSFYVRPAGRPKPRPRKPNKTSADEDKSPEASPQCSKSPGLFSALSKPFQRRKPEPKTVDPSPTPPTATATSSIRVTRNRGQIAEVVLPAASSSSHRSKPSSSLQSFDDPLDQSSSRQPSIATGPSTASLASYATSSFSSISPDSPEYPYELERLRIQYRASEESLRIECERNIAEQELFQRERAAREAHHRDELNAIRREYGSDQSKGKRRM